MTLPHRIAAALGPDSWLTRRLRPVREWALEAAYGHRGLVRRVNGVPLRILPQYRWAFPPAYDAHVAEYLRQRVRPGSVCVNVGANLGVYALQFAHWSAPGGRVYAFEPNPRTAAVLRRHVELNGLADRICVVERAVAEQPGTATFHAAGTDGMSRLGTPNPELPVPAAAVNVQVDSLDHFCASEGIRPAALMIDVEGFECAVLRGAGTVFAAGTPPAAVVEMHPNAWAAAGSDRAAFEALLAEYRLQAVPLSGQRDPLADYGHVALEPAAG